MNADTLIDRVDRDRLIDRFLTLAKVNAPSGSEKPLADHLEEPLETMGFSIEYDQAGDELDGNCGNMFAYWEGTDSDAEPMFLSTHLDTVLPTEGLSPVIEDGVIRTDGTTILGADDRAALAAYLEAIRVIQDHGGRCGPIELVLTVREQEGLLGARAMDFSRIRSERGFIFDSSGDVGQIILRGPYGRKLWWDVEGKPSHVGLAPEDGISAIQIAADAVTQMKLGKVDDVTHANLGRIGGGELASIIPEHVSMVGEVRSLVEENLQAQVEHMKQAVEDAARSRGGTVSCREEEKYRGFDVPEDHSHVRVAVRSMEKIGVDPYFTETLGGADTNIFNQHGLLCFTMGLGFRDIHSFDEHISVENLVNTARCTVGLIEEFDRES